MGDLLIAALVLGCALALFATTRQGRRLIARSGVSLPSRAKPGRLAGKKASEEDHAYLLRICAGDYDQLRERLEVELGINPHLSEAEAYRKAIRRHMKNEH